MEDYWFFVSYGREDNSIDQYVKKFKEDLELDVAAKLSQKPTSDVGFLDTGSICPGDNWHHSLRIALQTCRTMICLYSRKYFDSPYCAKEWQAFRNRIQAAFPNASNYPPLIIPIIWDPYKLPSPFPNMLREIQLFDLGFGNFLAERGLSMFLKQSKYRDDYVDLCNSLAERIVDVGEKHHIEQAYRIPDISEVKAPWPAQNQNHNINDTTFFNETGPRFAKFLFLTGSRSEMKTIRELVSFYGSDPHRRDWRPYLTGTREDGEQQEPPFHSRDSIAFIAQQAAGRDEFIFEVLPPLTNVLTALREAEGVNNVVILVIDPWALQLLPYQKLTSRFDRERFHNCGLLIVWNNNDEETESNRGILRETLNKALTRNLTWTSECLCDSIHSQADLEQELFKMLIRVRQQIGRTAKVGPFPRGSLPKVSGVFPSGLAV